MSEEKEPFLQYLRKLDGQLTFLASFWTDDVGLSYLNMNHDIYTLITTIEKAQTEAKRAYEEVVNNISINEISACVDQIEHDYDSLMLH